MEKEYSYKSEAKRKISFKKKKKKPREMWSTMMDRKILEKQPLENYYILV